MLLFRNSTTVSLFLCRVITAQSSQTVLPLLVFQPVLPLLFFFTRSVFFSVLSGVLEFLLKIWVFLALAKF